MESLLQYDTNDLIGYLLLQGAVLTTVYRRQGHPAGAPTLERMLNLTTYQGLTRGLLRLAQVVSSLAFHHCLATLP